MVDFLHLPIYLVRNCPSLGATWLSHNGRSDHCGDDWYWVLNYGYSMVNDYSQNLISKINCWLMKYVVMLDILCLWRLHIIRLPFSCLYLEVCHFRSLFLLRTLSFDCLWRYCVFIVTNQKKIAYSTWLVW